MTYRETVLIAQPKRQASHRCPGPHVRGAGPPDNPHGLLQEMKREKHRAGLCTLRSGRTVASTSLILSGGGTNRSEPGMVQG
jgi:hypothetical protein